MKIRNNDWVLFFTIVVMVMFGLVIVTSASSVMAELKYNASWLFLASGAGAGRRTRR